MGQTVLTQSDCRIFQSTIFPEQVNEMTWSFACWYKYKVDQRFMGRQGQK